MSNRPKTLGELRRGAWSEEKIAKRSVKQELRENLLERLEKGEPSGSIEHLARILHVLGEIQRLEQLLDTGTDAVGLVMMDEDLPERVRRRRSTGAM